MTPAARAAVCVLAIGLLLVACGHSDPFTPRDWTTTQPYSTGSPRQLTFSIADDRTPAWLPDGSAQSDFNAPNHRPDIWLFDLN